MYQLTVEDVPKEVIQAAFTLDRFFKEQGCFEWQLMNVCSRNHAFRLETALENLKAYERLDVLKPVPPKSG